MIKEFKTKKELTKYLNTISNQEKNEFYSQLDEYTRFINLREDVYKGKIADILINGFDDDKKAILDIKSLAKEAMDLSSYKPFELTVDDISIEEVCNSYDLYLKTLYRFETYFGKVYDVSDMFASNLFGCGEYMEVPGILTGSYNGKNNGYDKKEAKTKYIYSIMSISKIIEASLYDSPEFSGEGLIDDTYVDFLYDVAKFCIDNNKVSINLIQQQFGLGFNRASRIVDELIKMKAIVKEGNIKKIVWTMEDLNKNLQ